MTTSDNQNAEVAVRRTVESWAQAIRDKNVQALLKQYAPDFRSFDIAPPLQTQGAETRGKAMTQWFKNWSGTIDYEITQQVIVAGADAAYSSSLNHVAAKRADDGSAVEWWMRATIGLRKSGGEWLITHEHTSVPFYMDGSYRAAIDLKP